MPEQSRELTLYVQSKKAVTTFYRTPAGNPPAAVAMGVPPHLGTPSTSADATAGDSVYFLSDEQARCVAMVEEIAAQRGYHLKVVDVEKVGRIEQFIGMLKRGEKFHP